MTARSLTGNFSNFGAYFLHKLQSLRSMIILNSIFALLSYPLMMGTFLTYANVEVQLEKLYEAGLDDTMAYLALLEQSYSLESLSIAAIFIGFIMLAAMFIMSYVICSKSFRWLYKKTIVDMDYSLPVSDDTRFFGDLLASLAGSFVPHFLAILIGSGLYWCMPFDALEAPAGEVSAIFNLLQQLVYTGLFSCVMFMGISLFVMSLCGRAIEAYIMPFVINAAIPAIHAVCIVMLVSNMYGYSGNGDYEYIGLASTSPLGLLIMTFVSIASGSGDLEDFSVVMLRPDVLVPLLIVTIGAFVAAYFLIRFRRAERVGSPYVYPAVKVVIPAIVTFTVVSMFMLAILEELEYLRLSEMSGVIVAMIVITFIIYIIMELISGKGFKKFHYTLVKYVCTMAVCVLLSTGLYYTNGAGLARVVPADSDVNSVTIDLYPNYEFTDNAWHATVTDAESIAAITDFHDSLPKSGDDEYTDLWFNIDYNLKSGSTLSRRYSLTDEQYLEALKSVVTPEVHYYEHFSSTFDYLDWENGENDCQVIQVITDSKTKRVSISMEELSEAFRADCENLTYPLLYGDTSVERDYLGLTIERTYRSENDEPYSYTNTETLVVYSWYENTIKLFEREGVSLFDDNTNKCRTAFAVKMPYGSYSSVYNNYSDLNAQTLLLASLKDVLPVEVLESYGYYEDYDYYYDGYYYEEYYYDDYYSYDVPTVAAVEYPTYNSIISEDWELYTMEADDPNAQQLKKWSSDILPVDYSKPYDENSYIIVLLFTDASATQLEMTGTIEYDYEIISFVTPENYEKAEQLLDKLA